MKHVVLLGDSIFDNARYVRGKPAVIEQVRELLAQGDKTTLLAVDGDRVADVEEQLKHLPEDATHLVISIGGNDALDEIGILSEGARSFAEVLDRLAGIGEQFGADYREMLENVLRHHEVLPKK